MKKINNDEIMKRIGKNTGSPESQIFFLTQKMKYLNEHMNKNKHDYVSLRSLEKINNDRKRSLKYLKKISPKRFNEVLSIIK